MLPSEAVFNTLRAQRLQSTFIDRDRQGRHASSLLKPEKNPKWMKEHVNPMQLWLLMNATQTLGTEVIRKLAIITRQAERIHLSQPERQRSSSSRLADDNAS